MRPILKTLALIITMILFNLAHTEAQTMKMHIKTSESEELRSAMHKLWEDHVVWTRNVILNIIDGLPGTEQAVARLLKNQDDIGNAIKPFYGNAAGEQLTRLLKEHITIAADLLTAANPEIIQLLNKLTKNGSLMLMQ